MADVVEETDFIDAATAITQGKRHLLVRDYSNAVNALTQACELLALKHGDTADELGEPYLLYGRALLFLAREEAGVLVTSAPNNEEADEDEATEENDEEGDEAETKTECENEAKSENVAEKVVTEKECNAENQDETKDNAENEKKNEVEKKLESEPSTSGESKIDDSLPGTSTGSITNGKNADLANGTEDDDGSDDDNKDDDEEEIHNLQVAWEVLELAKVVLLKRGPPGWKHLAEAHRLLGEVAMESGNAQGAVIDLNACLDLLNKIEPKDPRVIAETHYQLGLAYSLANEFDASIEQFNSAITLLETRIEELERLTTPPKSENPFYTVEGEIRELKELLPEIQDKVTDMKEYKEEACRLMIEGIKSKAASCSNGAGPSGAGSSSVTSPISSKPASDISHLIRKKRKPEDAVESAASPCKKPTP